MKLSDFGPINPLGKGGLGSFLAGDDPGVEQYSLKTPEQEAFLKSQFTNNVEGSPLYQSGASYLQRALSNDPNAYSEFNAPYMQQFQQQVIPGLSERFAGMGTGAGSLNSSAFNQTLSQAGSGLQATLAQLRQQLMGQASQQALGYAQQPFTNRYQGLGTNAFENVKQQPSPGFLQTALPGLLSAGLTMFGGPAGAIAGPLLGAGLSGAFNSGNVLGSSRSVMGTPGG